MPFEIQRILMKLDDRFEKGVDPPAHPRTGKPQRRQTGRAVR
ncbi:hypothetical protein AB0F64_04680 [Streptomyces sp. NPDC026294]